MFISLLAIEFLLNLFSHISLTLESNPVFSFSIFYLWIYLSPNVRIFTTLSLSL